MESQVKTFRCGIYLCNRDIRDLPMLLRCYPRPDLRQAERHHRVASYRIGKLGAILDLAVSQQFMLAQGPFVVPSGHGGHTRVHRRPVSQCSSLGRSSHAVKMRGLKPSRVDPCLISLALAASPAAPLGYRQIFIHNGGSDPFFTLLRRSTRPNFPRLTAGSTANHTDRAGLGRVSHWLDPVWPVSGLGGEAEGKHCTLLHAAARGRWIELLGPGSWDLGISWAPSWIMGPSHHTTNHTATTQVAHCRSVGWRAHGRERPTRRLAWSCGGDVFNGGSVALPPCRDPPWKVVDEKRQ